MAYSNRGKARRLTEWDMEDDQEEMPDRSIGKVSRADVIQPVAPASQVPQAQPAKMARTGDPYKYGGGDLSAYLQEAQKNFVGEMVAPTYVGPQHDAWVESWVGPPTPTMTQFDPLVAELDYNRTRKEANPRLTGNRLSAINAIVGSTHGAARTLAKKSGYMGPLGTPYLEASGVPQHDNYVSKEGMYSANPDFLDALSQYDYKPAKIGNNPGYDVFDQGGQKVSTERTGDGHSFFWDSLLPGITQAGLAAIVGPMAGGLLGGGVVGGALGGAATGGLLAAAFDQDVGKGALMGGIGGGFNGYMRGVPAGGDVASSVAGVPWEAQAALDAYAQSPMPDMMHGMPDLGGAQSFGVPQTMPSWTDAVHGQNVASLDQFAQQPMQMPMPEWQQTAAQVPASGVSDFRAEEIRGYQTDGSMPSSPAVSASPPASGVSDFRKSEIDGYQTDGSMPSSPAVPTGTGGLLGSLKAGGSTALDWMKTNPGLAKLLLGGAGSLLSTQGGAGGGAPKPYGAPVQWNSALPKISPGILGGQSGGQSSGYPPALGLMGGQANSGAWRFLGG